MTARKLRIMVCIDLQWALRRHQDVYAGIRDYARDKSNWDLWVDPWFNFEKVDLRAQGIDAAIGRLEPDILDAVRRAKLPCVTTRLYPIEKLPDVARVMIDDSRVMRLAVEHLVERGYRRVEYIRTYPKLLNVRAQAFADMAQSDGLPHRETHLPREQLVAMELHQAFDRWVDSLTPPVGVVTDTDDVAMAVAAACLRRGWGIPEQVGLVGIGNDEGHCQANEPTLSSVDANYAKVGVEAARALDMILQGKAGLDLEKIIAPLGVVTRQSTDFQFTDDAIVAMALASIRERFREDLSVGDIVAASGLGLRTLQARFHKVTGRSIAEDLARRRADNAVHLLSQTNWSIERVAMASGFGSARRMHRTFIKLFSRAPSELRGQNANSAV